MEKSRLGPSRFAQIDDPCECRSEASQRNREADFLARIVRRDLYGEGTPGTQDGGSRSSTAFRMREG